MSKGMSEFVLCGDTLDDLTHAYYKPTSICKGPGTFCEKDISWWSRLS